MGQYPTGFISIKGGPSESFQRECGVVREMTWLGRTSRRVRYATTVGVCPFFREFVMLKTGTVPQDLWPQYRRTVCNHLAGYKSVAKYEKAQPVLNLSSWRLAGDWTIRHFAPYLSGSRVIDCDFARSEMDKQTSPGYPWNLVSRTKSGVLCTKMYQDYVADFWKRLASSKRCPVIWCSNVKDELRSKEKLDANKLRTFTGAPLEHVECTMRMCWDMNNSFYRSNNKTWSFVGSSKFRRAWDNLFQRLSKHPNAFELDESAYDASLFREAMFGMIDFRWAMFAPSDRTPDNRVRLEALYLEIVDSIMVCSEGDLVSKNTGNPSGSANTIVDNTVVLFRLMAYAWIELWMKAKASNRTGPLFQDLVEPSYNHFVAEVEAALNGDDNTWTASHVVVPWYNAKAVSAVWSDIGVVTHCDTYEPRHLSECSFLSMSFKKAGSNSSLYVPVPEKEKVYCALLWGGRCLSNPRMSLLRAYALRIESYWDSECRVLLMEYIKWLLLTYHDALHAAPAKTGLDFTFDQVQSVFRTDGEIESLYLGYESSSNPVFRPGYCHEFLSESGLESMDPDKNFRDGEKEFEESKEIQATINSGCAAATAAQAQA